MKTIEKKEPYLHILNTRGNIYEEFLPDQVLTHKNLNKVVNYFEDQDRISRVYLIGVGIGCGINIVSYSNAHIEIGQGVGITTDGDIIKTETRRFQYYTELTDRAAYALFEGRKIYEIYEQEGAGRLQDELPLTSFNSNETGTLKDYIVIAYVENYTEDEGLCGGSGCDETGNKVYSNLKFLLTHKNNYAALISNDTIYKSHDVLSYYDSLPELCMPRLLLTKSNTTSGISIHDQFKNSFVLKTQLYAGITTIIQRFSHRINFAKFGVNIPEITSYFDSIFTVQQEQFIQYKYDLLKDLIDTYREIRELILHTRFECVANINAFPKHLLLGTLEEQTRLQTRHDFYPSPTVSENDENLLSIRALCIKFFNQLKEYNIPNVPTAAIKITPSKSYEFKLSERTIPYYYETKNSLISNWNPISIQQRKPKNQLGYHVSNLTNIPCIQDPLRYSHLDKDFYRIEGHIGKDFRLALKKINSLKATYNLAFDVKTISIGFPVNKITLDDDKCDTKDYAILLKNWEREFNCTADSATEFFQKYQFDALGDNDTSTTVYTQATQQLQVLQLLRKQKATDTNPEKITTKALNINTNASAESTQAQARYISSLQYAMDQAYTYVGTQNVPAGYLATVALEIIEESLGTVDKNDDYFFYTESPIKIITGLADIKRNFLQSLNEIYNTEKWTALNNAIEKLCADIDQILFAISQAGENSVFGTKTHDKMYEYFIYDLSKTCCLKGRFTWLKEQIDDIRNNLYKELILSRLIEKHPGIEHMAGVPKGGTFLMVYLGGTESVLDDTGAVEREFNGQVQFDFALPYMCCSDCPPETIVYNTAEAETTLTIAKTKYCLPTDEGLENFITGSTGDVVTSPEGEAFIVPTDTGYAFDPSAVPDDLLGQSLTFLVNGKVPTIPVEICVFKLPTDITATEEFLSWSDAGINLDLMVNHEDLTYPYEFSYTWKRADGTEIGTGMTLSEILIENPGASFIETFTVTIGVEGNPDVCTVDAFVEMNYTRPVDKDVDVPPIFCHNVQETSPAPVPITVTPEGATVTSPQDIVDPSFIIQDQSGNYYIDPARVPDTLVGEEITFEVNGELIVGKSTRIGRLPAAINIDENGEQIQPYEIIGWTEEGVKVNIIAAEHAYQDETYIEYRWTNRDTNQEIGTTRLLSEILIPGPETTATANFSLAMRVIGLEDACNTSFDVDFSIPRPTLNIPTGICFGESIELDISENDIVETIPQEGLIENNSGTFLFNSAAVNDDLIGQPIEIEINGSLAATTTVYKVPTRSNITADDLFVRWEGDDVIVNLVANYTVPDVTNPENYLEVKWFDNEGNPIPNEELAGYAINTDGGIVNTTFSVTVSVRDDLGVLISCENSIDVPINHIRPEPEPTLPPNLSLETEYCWKNGTEDLVITIPVSPSDFDIQSPQGSTFLTPNGDNYKFNASNIPDNESGEEIQFEVDGSIVGTTRIFKMPADTSIVHDVNNSQLNGDTYFFRFDHDFGQKNYMIYKVVDISTGQELTPISSNPLTYNVIATSEPRGLRYKVTISLDGLPCLSTRTVTVVVPAREQQPTDPILTDPIDPIDPTGPTGPTNPTNAFKGLVCTTSYADRLNILGFEEEFSKLNATFKGKPYGSQLKKSILDPVSSIYAKIKGSRNLTNDSIEGVNEINNLRVLLENNFLKNPNAGKDKELFLNLDEVLEIMSLELLRCIENDTASSLIVGLSNTSTSRNNDYTDGSRTKITEEYLNTFSDKGQSFKNSISTTFSTKKR